MFEMEFRKNPLPGENCYIMALNNILDYKGFSKFLSLWKICGLFYDANPGHAIGILSPRDLSIQEEMRLIHGVELYTLSSDDVDEVISNVIRIIEDNEPVLVFVDAYELPYHLCYHKNHVKHCITLLDYRNDGFLFLDDHHQVKSELSHGILKAAMCLDHESINNKHGSFKARWIYCENASKDMNRENFLRVVRHNTSLLSGSDGVLDYVPDFHEQSGLDSISVLLEDLDAIDRSPRDLYAEELQGIHHYINFVANSRYLYCEFLKEGILYHHNVQHLIEKYSLSGQSWKIISNMALKMIYATDRAAMFNRLMNKFREAQSYEQEALNVGESIAG